jgi:hypothetical protein
MPVEYVAWRLMMSSPETQKPKPSTRARSRRRGLWIPSGIAALGLAGLVVLAAASWLFTDDPRMLTPENVESITLVYAPRASRAASSEAGPVQETVRDAETIRQLVSALHFKTKPPCGCDHQEKLIFHTKAETFRFSICSHCLDHLNSGPSYPWPIGSGSRYLGLYDMPRELYALFTARRKAYEARARTKAPAASEPVRIDP